MGIHTRLPTAQPIHFFPCHLTNGTRRAVKGSGGKTAQRSCSGFFQIRTCAALDRFGVWSYLCRLKRGKLLVAIMSLHLNDKYKNLFIVDVVNYPVLGGYVA